MAREKWRRDQDRAIGGDRTPRKDAEVKLVCDRGKDRLLLCLLVWVVWFEEGIANGVSAGLRKETAEFTLGLTLEEVMGDAGQAAGTVTVSAVCSCGVSVGHC